MFAVLVELRCVETGQLVYKEVVSLLSLRAARQHLRDSIRSLSEGCRDAEMIIDYSIKRLRMTVED